MSQSRDERREATAPPPERPEVTTPPPEGPEVTASPADRPDPTNRTHPAAPPAERPPSRPEPSPVATAPPSSAIVTAPNAISLARLLLMPVCAWLLATQHYASGLVLTTVVGASDWVDGWLARRIRQVSRVGQLLDPFADRALIASVAVALLVRGVLPWPAVALLVGRDLVLLAGWPLLKRRGVEPPEVVWIGKAATFDLLFALPLLVMGETTWVVATVAHALGLALLWLGVVLYYVAGVVYVRMALDGLARRERAGT
jgi:cardiolipin synthase